MNMYKQFIHSEQDRKNFICILKFDNVILFNNNWCSATQ